jgi:hypothetical protein
MTKSEHHKPINFVGLYFADEEGSETGQIIAQIPVRSPKERLATPIGSLVIRRL